MKSLLDELNKNSTPLQQAVEAQALVAKVNFDWPALRDVFAKLQEEIHELEVEIAADDKTKMLDELGDVLFVCANIARWLNIDPEQALAHANQKFEQRFRLMETQLLQKHATLSECNFDDMLAAWESVKQLLKQTT